MFSPSGRTFSPIPIIELWASFFGQQKRSVYTEEGPFISFWRWKRRPLVTANGGRACRVAHRPENILTPAQKTFTLVYN